MSNIFSYLVRDTGGYIPFNSGSGPISGGIKSQHLWLDTEGAVYAVIDGIVDHWGAGLPFDINGRLVISTSPVAYFDQKMPFTANGLLAVGTGTGDHYDQGIIHGPGGGLGGIGVGYEWTPNLNGINSYGALSAPATANADWAAELVFYLKGNPVVLPMSAAVSSIYVNTTGAGAVVNWDSTGRGGGLIGCSAGNPG